MDLFKLSAKLVLDKSEYDRGVEDAESKAYKTGQGIGTGLRGIGGAFGTAIAGMAALTVAGITAASGAISALVKQSVSEYAEYQQLLGGVQKLYGTAGMSIEQYAESVGKSVDEVKDKYSELTQAQDLVLQNAQNAYATAGMSTQQYMEQATSFSASLINSLGGDTVKAAEQTDVAMRAIADNYNTFGGDMQNIQNAFQGFAKQNYTMLDNLKLGYGGTKTEMERLIEDANEYAASIGEASDLSIDSFSDIVTAIDLIQQKQGVAGTTAREAASTISGSLGMLKASWENLVAGMADPDADLSTLMENVVSSAKTYIENILPTIKQATTSIVQLVSEIAPMIAEELPSLLEEILPMIIETAIELFDGLVAALPDVMQILFDQLPLIISAIVDTITTLLPMIIELGGQFLLSLADGILQALPEIIPQLIEVIMEIAEMLSDPSNLLLLLDAAVAIIQELALGLVSALPDLIPAVIDVILAMVEAFTEPTNLLTLIDAALSIIIALADGLIQSLPVLIERLPFIVLNIVETLIGLAPQLIKSGLELIAKLALGLLQARAKVVKAIVNVFTKIRDTFHERIDRAKEWGKDLIQNFIDGIKAKFEALKNTVKDVASSVKSFLGFSEPEEGPLSNFHTYAPDMMDLFMQGINDNKDRLLDTVQSAFDFQNLITAPLMNAEIGEMGYNGITGGNDMYSMLEQIMTYLPQLANSQIVLDTGILVGETAPKMDIALGQIMTNRARSV